MTREEALREIVAVMREGMADQEQFLAQVIAREKEISTFMGNGVAFPHARTDLAKEIVLGIGRSVAGVPFGAEGEQSHLIFVIAVPQRMVSDYLVCVGALARLTKDEDARSALLRASTAGEVVELLRAGSLELE